MRQDGVHHHGRVGIGAHNVDKCYGLAERHLAGDLLVRKRHAGQLLRPRAWPAHELDENGPFVAGDDVATEHAEAAIVRDRRVIIEYVLREHLG